jgi:group I intron endonuclease
MKAYLKKGKSAICSSILNNGLSKFSLEILEYCGASSPSNIIEREQYYLDTLKPEYNILKIAGSPLGRKHSEESRAKMNASHMGKILSEKTKALMSEKKKGENHPLFGKTRSESTKSKISVAMLSAQKGCVEVMDKETGKTTIYFSNCQAARAIGCSEFTVRKYIKSQMPYKGR